MTKNRRKLNLQEEYWVFSSFSGASRITVCVSLQTILTWMNSTFLSAYATDSGRYQLGAKAYTATTRCPGMSKEHIDFSFLFSL